MGFLRYLLGTSESYNTGAEDAEDYMESTDSAEMPHGRYIQNRWRNSGAEDIEDYYEGFVDRVNQESEPSFFKRWFSF